MGAFSTFRRSAVRRTSPAFAPVLVPRPGRKRPRALAAPKAAAERSKKALRLKLREDYDSTE